MSLYNMLFGKNAFSATLLEMLGLTESEVPRFRDCYLSGDEIIIHTRTGGRNRADYQAENDALARVPGYLGDSDDDFDCTYADFRYAIPVAFRDQVALLREMGAEMVAPAEKWQALLSDLRRKESTPETDRALKIGERIFEQIKEWTEKGGE